jgi:DNA modification methylase
MLKELPISKLILLEKNPRRISQQQMDKLQKSIQDDPNFLICRPVLVNKVDDKFLVYAGNQRVRAAKKLGWKKIQCNIDENLTEEKVKQRVIKDNKTYGEFDFDILANEWDVDLLKDCGFIDSEIPELNVEDLGYIEEDAGILEPKKDEDAFTKLNDIYELNEHRLLCADSTLSNDVEKCLNGNEPILMITDPPYGVNYDPNWRVKSQKGARAIGKVKNDHQVNWSLAWHLFPGSIAYVWHADKYCAEVEKSLTDCEYEIISQIIWVKQHFALSRGDYHWKHEPCWYAVKKGHQHNWQGSRKESTVWEISNLNAFGKSKEDGEERTTHSTQKPLECMARPIRNNTSKGESVYDPFIGSGTTLIAAEKLGRICYGLELSPAYCDIIVERWIKHMKNNNKEYIIKRNGVPFNIE